MSAVENQPTNVADVLKVATQTDDYKTAIEEAVVEAKQLKTRQ